MHRLLVNRLVKLVQEKCVVRLTNHFDMTKAVEFQHFSFNEQLKFYA